MATTPKKQDKPISSNVIGRPATTGPSTAVPTPTPTPTKVAVDPNLSTRIGNKLNNLANFPILNGLSVDSVAQAEVYTDVQLTSIGKVLKKLGYSVKPNVGSIKTLLTTEPELIQMTGTYPRYTDFINKLGEQYLPGLDGTGAAPNIPTRQVYKYSDESIGALINSAYQDKFGRDATDEEKAAKTASIRKELEVGTVSTTKKVKNPKTGKMENVVTQEQQGLTPELATKKLEEQLQASNPEAYQRNKALAFNSEVNKLMAGGI